MKNNIKKDFVWNTIGSFIYSLTSLVFMIIATRIVGPDKTGIFVFAFTTASILQAIGTYAGRTYQITENDKNINDTDFFYNRIISCIVMLLIGLLYVAFKGYSLNKSLIIMALAIFRCIDAFAEYLYAIIQKKQHLYKVGKSLFIKAVVEDIAFFLVIYFTKNVLYSCLTLILINALVTYFYDYKNAKKLGFKVLDINMKNVFNIFKFGLWVFLSVFLLQYIYNASKYAIDSYMEDYYQTIFGILIMPATFIYLLSQFVVQPYLVPINEMIKKNETKKLNNLVLKTTLVLLVCGILCVVLAGVLGVPVLNFIYKVDIADYKFDLLLIIFSASLYSCSYIMINILIAMRKTFVQMISYLVVSLASFGFSRLLVYRFGIRGATVSYFISMILIAIIYTIFYCYFVNKKNNKLIKNVRR